MNTRTVNKTTHAIIVVSALLALSACSSTSSTSAATGGSTHAAGSSSSSASGGSSNPGSAGGGSADSVSDACSLLTTAQVAALTGGTPTATPHSSSVLETSDCAYKAASLNEVDLSIAPVALSPACSADAGAVLVTGVGKCATYDSEISILTVYGTTYSGSISVSGFQATEAQLEQLGTDIAPKL